MRYWKAVVLGGHQGATKSKELTFYFACEKAMSVYVKVKTMPSIKHHKSCAIQLIKEVTKEEYEQNKVISAYMRNVECF